VSGIGAALVHTVLAIILAGILMATFEGRAQTVRAIALRLGGERGPAMLDLSVGTIRSVVKGVVLVALIQGLLAAGGLAIADVPGAGLWALLVTMLAVMQLPPLLVLGPIIPWVFANNDSSVVAIFFTVWSLIVSFSDPFLKMLLLGRGVGVPMPVILVGAIGGLLQSGMVGLFVGPVILAIFYQVFTAWVGEAEARSAAKPEPDTAR
jgi:predicted PurR-regulated permease PerM